MMKQNIGATIRIGQEIWCLPYVDFFLPKTILGWAIWRHPIILLSLQYV